MDISATSRNETAKGGASTTKSSLAESEAESAKLDALRGQIDQIDGQVVEFLARRRRVVEEIMQVKQELDLPMYHPAREENLISSRRDQASKAGLDPDYIEDLFRTVLRHSRVGQLQELGRRGVRPGAKVLVVGGKGSMGKFFAEWFLHSDYHVRVLDRNEWDQVEALVSGIDLCLLAVPIELTADVAARIAPLLPPTCVLADITSLKRGPLDAMLRSHQGPVVGLHPLFGPTTASMDKQSSR